ncbi:MAG: hypothetical protein ACRCYC_05315 [Paraclostridium sp.]|uniref:hypothetical protein n=1 Tax=Paraclostridium sp. TaxID=2023273 RepID=UPI003F2E0AAE
MLGMEKEILVLMSQVRCATEQQFNKFFSKKRKIVKSPYKKTLRKMCREFTLKKYPCNIAYGEYKDSSGIYYLNGGKIYKGKELLKVIIGSEIALKMESSGYEIKRFYRNITIDKDKYDIYIEYINKDKELKQKLIDIKLSDILKSSKYKNLPYKVVNSTIPFFEIPGVLIITQEKSINEEKLRSIGKNISVVDMSLDNLTKYL